MSDDLDDLLKELKNTKKDENIPAPVQKNKDIVKDDNVNDYVLKKASELIETGMFTVEAMKNSISSAYESDEIEAYATLIKSVNDSIDTLNKINLQNKKIKSSKEIKQMDIDARQQLGPAQHNTNVLIATRDEIMKNIINKIDNSSDNIINAEYEEKNN
jgi:hypothetical protein